MATHMFTGIIKETGMVVGITPYKSSTALSISARKIKPHLGDSISIDGVCLTVKKVQAGRFDVDVVPETLKRTTLKYLTKNAVVNMEPSLKVNDRIDGHFVTGHVDGTGTVVSHTKNKKGTLLSVRVPNELKKFIAEKGSITINGISLTVAAIKGSTCSVALIPFTEEHTTMRSIKKGDHVNIEVDIIARYLKKLFS